MKKLFVVVLCLVAVGLVAVNANASVTLVNSYSTFLNYFPNPVVENFEDQVLAPGLAITSTSGLSSIHNGVYEDVVNADNGWTQTFSFSGLVYGFGAWLDLAGPGGPGTGIKVSLLDLGIDVGEVPPSQIGQFWGFISTEPFTQVLFSQGTASADQETYYSIDLAYSQPQPVPIPAAAWLLGTGLVGLFGLRRKLRG